MADHVEKQLLVAFTDDAAAQKRSDIFAKYKAKELQRVGSTHLYLIEIPNEKDLSQVQKSLSQTPGIKYAEPNLKMRTFQGGTK